MIFSCIQFLLELIKLFRPVRGQLFLNEVCLCCCCFFKCSAWVLHKYVSLKLSLSHSSEQGNPLDRRKDYVGIKFKVLLQTKVNINYSASIRVALYCLHAVNRTVGQTRAGCQLQGHTKKFLYI